MSDCNRCVWSRRDGGCNSWDCNFIDQNDAVKCQKVTRCRDCKYQDKNENEKETWNLCGYRPWLYVPVTDDHFCGYAKRKDGEADEVE